MSLVAIRNGLYRTLTACGPYAASEVSTCSFDVLEATNSGCAIVFMPGPESPIEPIRDGGTNARGYRRMWGIQGAVYIRDTGDPTALLGKLWQAHDDLYNTISKDDSLNSSACAARLTRISYREGNFVETGGQLWAPVEFSLEAEEF